MRSAFLFCALVCSLIPRTWQFSLDRPTSYGMVSDAWFDDILTDGWNGVPRGCGGKPTDVYFVLDTSADTPTEDLKEQKRFLSDLSAIFYLRKTATRLGIVSYGHTPYVTTPLGTYVTLPEVQAAVEDTPSIGGSRQTAKALKYLRKRAFSPLVVRREVSHVIILLTNGFSADAEHVAEEASLLRKQGVYVYVVSTAASRLDKAELDAMAAFPTQSFVFSSDNLRIVDSLIDLLHIKECNYQVLPPLPGKEPVCVSRRPTRIVIALEHLSLGAGKTRTLIAFIQGLLAEVDPDSDVKAALLTSRDPVSRLNHYGNHVDSVSLLEKTLGQVIFPDLSSLLRRARKALSPAKRSRVFRRRWSSKAKKLASSEEGGDDEDARGKAERGSRISSRSNGSPRLAKMTGLGGSVYDDARQKVDRKFKVSRRISRSNLSSKLKQKKNWASVSNDVINDQDDDDDDDDNAQKVVLVFVDDSVKVTKRTLAQARANHAGKLDTYVVRIGEGDGFGLDSSELSQLASGKDHIISIPDYKSLWDHSTVVSTLSTVCRGL